MYKILSWNVNGLRSCLRNGFEDQIWRLDCDVICLQEVKLSDTDILEEMLPDGYAYVDHLSSNKGRNGVVVFSRLQPKAVYKRMGLKEFDAQGRFLRIDFEDFILINLYMPHGGRDKKTLGFKLEAYEWLKKRMENLADKPVVLAGDFNIAAEDIDVCRAGQNRNNIMFTSEERQLICDMKQLGYVDVFRKLYPDKMAYTWWSYAFQCRERNIGWRIDYFWTTKEMFQYVECVEVLEQIKGSDHCPIMLRMYGEKRMKNTIESLKEVWKIIGDDIPKGFRNIVFLLLLGIGVVFGFIYANFEKVDKAVQNSTYTGLVKILMVLGTVLFGVMVLIVIRMVKGEAERKMKTNDKTSDINGYVSAYIVKQSDSKREAHFAELNKDIKKTYYVLGTALTTIANKEGFLRDMVEQGIEIRLCSMNSDFIQENVCRSEIKNHSCYVIENIIKPNMDSDEDKIKIDKGVYEDFEKGIDHMNAGENLLGIEKFLIDKQHINAYFDTVTEFKENIETAHNNINSIRNNILEKYGKRAENKFLLRNSTSFIPISITIVDGQEADGKMIVEFHLPFTQYKVLFPIYKETNSDLFKIFNDFYGKVWDKAEK